METHKPVSSLEIVEPHQLGHHVRRKKVAEVPAQIQVFPDPFYNDEKVSGTVSEVIEATDPSGIPADHEPDQIPVR